MLLSETYSMYTEKQVLFSLKQEHLEQQGIQVAKDLIKSNVRLEIKK